jgi:HEAT repeat protein
MDEDECWFVVQLFQETEIVMNRLRKAILAGLCAALCLVSSMSSADVKAGAEAVVAKMPAQTSKDQYGAAADLVKLGPEGIAHVCGMLTPPSTGGDTKVRFALNALSWYAHQPGKEAEAGMYAGVLLDSLKAASDNEVKAFLIRQLHLLESEQAVPALGGLLSDPRLCEPATQALLAIETKAAAAVLAKALPSAKGKNLVTIVKALGELREGSALSILAGHAASKDTTLRRTALFALANIGDPSSEKILASAVGASAGYERSKVTAMYLLYAGRLAEQGKRNDCARICRDLIKARTAPGESSAQTAALSVLVENLGSEATDDMMKALRSENKVVYAAALKLAMKVPGKAMTGTLVEKMKKASPDVKLEIIGILGARGEESALPGLLDALKEKDKAVRLAAASAASKAGGALAAPALVAALGAGEKDEAMAVKGIILRLPGDEAMSAVARALPKADSGTKVALMDILAERRAVAHKKVVLAQLKEKNPEVREAAIKALGNLAGGEDMQQLVSLLVKAGSEKEKSAIQAVVSSVARRTKDSASGFKAVQSALKGAGPEVKCGLLGVLPAIGSKAGLETVIAESKGSDAAVKDAAIRALSEWPDASAGAAMLDVARKSGELKHQVLAIRGYVRVVGGADLPAASKAAMYNDAMAAAKRPEEKKLVLGGLSEIVHEDALAAVARYLDDKEISQEAAAAAVSIACPRKGGGGLLGDQVKAVLDKVIAVSKNAAVKETAKRHLRTLARGGTPLKPGLNLALRKPVKTSTNHEGSKVPEKAVDGNTESESAWFGAGSPAWLQVDLEQTVKISATRLFFYRGENRYYQYVVEVSGDGKSWSKVADMSKTTTPCTDQGALHEFDAVAARYVRINVSKNSANPSVHIAEVEVYADGTGPKLASVPVPAPATTPLAGPDSEGFTPLFNGKDLTGWIGDRKGYVVEDGKMLCKPGGNIYTEQQYDNFIFRFEFKLTPGANNGLGIRTPSKGNAAYAGMELQILDNTAQKYAKLQPFQYHGSIYGVVPAKRGHLKPVGEWNRQEVIADGPKIKVILNETVIVDADLSKLEQTGNMHNLKKHPGLLNKGGHIGFLGHGSVVEFRGMRIKTLNTDVTAPDSGVTGPPEGFTALFNGKDLTGWKGLVANPEKRAQMAPEALKAAQAKADESMRAHWNIVDGVLVFDGKGQSLCTAKDYGDFEMLVDWKIKKNGDSGIYLRGSPQVQIWDTAKWPVGSGGLYNNKKNPSKPLKCADNPVGEWNTFRIKMIGERVTIHLNGVLVVDNTVLENYWNRKKPIYPTGQIELQNHGNTLYFRNVFVREIQ